MLGGYSRRRAGAVRDAFGAVAVFAAPGQRRVNSRLVQLEVVPQRVEAVPRPHAAELDELVAARAAGGGVKNCQVGVWTARGARSAPRAPAAGFFALKRHATRRGTHKGSSDGASSGSATQPEAVCTGISGTRADPPLVVEGAGAVVWVALCGGRGASAKYAVAKAKAGGKSEKAENRVPRTFSAAATRRRAAAPCLRRRAGPVLLLTRRGDGGR